MKKIILIAIVLLLTQIAKGNEKSLKTTFVQTTSYNQNTDSVYIKIKGCSSILSACNKDYPELKWTTPGDVIEITFNTNIKSITSFDNLSLSIDNVDDCSFDWVINVLGYKIVADNAYIIFNQPTPNSKLSEINAKLSKFSVLNDIKAGDSVRIMRSSKEVYAIKKL